MTRRTLLFLVSIGVAVAVGAVAGQQPARQINPAPLDHPQPIASIRSADAPAVMTQLRTIAMQSGFAITTRMQGEATDGTAQAPEKE